jgi:uncharacterized protein (TIRG00374 family)
MLLGTIKVLLSGLMFIYLFNKYDFSKVYINFNLFNTLVAIFFCSICLFIQGILSSIRLQSIANYLKTKIKFKSVWEASSIGGLYSHTPLSFIGGDLMRIITLSKLGISIKRLTAMVFLDRLIGILGLMTLCTFFVSIMSIMLLLEPDYLKSKSILALVIIPIFTLTTYIFLDEKIQDLLVKLLPKKIRALLKYSVSFTKTIRCKLSPLLLISILAYIFAIFGFLVINFSLNLGIPYQTIIIFIPLAIFVSLIPISLGGWGLREGATVYILGKQGISPEISIALSITYGISVFLAFIPGSVTHVIRRLKIKI